ncbi:conjugal transfer protein TraG N-terminal domain-containing protein [Sulfurimonas sp.]|uniref:conjugal transfer protein TraG N-terminal domain-containing protein n=1 Tax=Sulfurimonas sp. TaxID=2022749 RepID=UPI003D11DA07
MFYRLLFLLISSVVFASGLNAAEITYVNAFPIYVYGDPTYIASIYEWIKGATTDSSTQYLIALGFSVAAAIAGWKARTGDITGVLKGISIPMTMYALFAVPTVNVHIVDQRVDYGLINYSTPDGGYKKVEDIPYMMAFIPSSSSLLVSLFDDLIDKYWFGIGDGSKFSTLGFQQVSQITKEAILIADMKDINQSKNGGLYNMNQYIKACLITQALNVSASNYHTLTHAEQVFPTMFDPAQYDGNIGSKTVTFQDANNTTFNGTCSQAYTNYISSQATAIETQMGDLLTARFPTVDTNNATFNEAWRDQIGDKINKVGTIQKMMATMAATRALEKSLDTEGIGVNGVSMATELSIDSTLQNLQVEGLAKWEFAVRVVPDGIFLVLGILIGAMPLMVIVMSFYGASAIKVIANYTMGYIAINFNMVSLALINNIMGIYTSKHAAEAISAYAGMPFGLSQVNDFMLKQADMAGMAGIIASVSLFVVGPLVFYGESKGLSAAISGVTGAYRGNVEQTAQKTLTDYDAQRTLDERAYTMHGHSEAEAAAWLNEEGFSRPNSMSAVQAYNDIMKNMSSIGSAEASQIMHSGRGGLNSQNYIEGSKGQSLQKLGQTAGLGASINNGVVSEAEIESVSLQNGEISGASIKATHDSREEGGFDAELVGYGQGKSQVAKEMGLQEIGNDEGAFEKLTASSRKSALEQLAAGEADKNMFENNNGFGALDIAGMDHLKNVQTQAAAKLMQSAGEGSTIDMDKAIAKAYEDGARTGDATNRTSDHMFSGDTDKEGRELYNRDLAAEGQSMQEMAKHQQSMQTAKAASNPLTGEQDGYADYITGKGASARKDANDAIGVGEGFGAMGDPEQIDLMRQVKENAERGFEGGIKASNAELHAGGRNVDQAISDDVTNAVEKGLNSKVHADNLEGKYGKNLKGKNSEDMSLEQTLDSIDQANLDMQAGKAKGIKNNVDAGVNYSDNAEYGEMSNQQSTKAKLDKQGGVDGAVHTDVLDAAIKAATQKDTLDKNLKQAGAEGGLDNSIKELSTAIDKLASTSGTIAGGKTKAGIDAVNTFDSDEQYIENQSKLATQQASKEKGKLLLDKDLNANAALANEMIARAGEGYIGDEKVKKMQQAESQLARAGLIKKQEDGSFIVATGSDFSNAMAVLNSGDMGRDNQVQIAGTSMNIDRDMDGNARFTNTSLDSTSRGEKLDYSVSGFAGAVGVGIAMGAGGLGVANQYSKHLAPEKIPMTLDDMSGYKDEGGGKYTDKNGKSFTLNQNGEVVRDGEVLKKDNPKYKKGYVKDAWDNAKNTLNEAGKNLRSSFPSETLDESVETKNYQTTYKDSGSSPDGNKNNMTHSDTSNLNSENSVAKSGESSKSIAQQIEEQNKKEKILNTDSRYKADLDRLNAQYAEQNRLNGGETPERAARHAKEVSSLQDQHMDRISKHNEALDGAKAKLAQKTKLNPGFWGKADRTLGAALEFGGRAFAGADVFMSGAEAKNQFDQGNYFTASTNALESTTAAAFMAKPGPYTGAAYGAATMLNLGSGAIKDLATRDWSANKFNTGYSGNMPLAAGIDPYSKVPGHAQNAFSTPSGFNTMQAMGGSVYNNAMDSRNVTPSGYKVDRSADSYDATRDVNKGLDGVMDSVGDLGDRLEESKFANDIDMDAIMREYE